MSSSPAHFEGVYYYRAALCGKSRRERHRWRLRQACRDRHGRVVWPSNGNSVTRRIFLKCSTQKKIKEIGALSQGVVIAAGRDRAPVSTFDGRLESIKHLAEITARIAENGDDIAAIEPKNK